MKQFYKNKRVFVTGHTGFKGSWLCGMLLELGADVCGYSLPPENNPLFDIFSLERRTKHIESDIRNLSKLKQAMQEYNPDIVFHLAAQPIVLKSYEEPVNTYETNVMGTVNLLESVRCCNNTKSVVNVTTDKVYYNENKKNLFREENRLCGTDPYSNSKSCSELVTYSYKQSFLQDIAVSTARAGNVIGGGDFAEKRIIPDCYRAASNNTVIELRNPNSTRPYQYVFDCLAGYLLLAKKQYQDLSYEGSYNFSLQTAIQTKELVQCFCDFWNQESHSKLVWDIASGANTAYEANFLELDATKARTILGWKPVFSIEESIKETAQWYHHHLYNTNTIQEYTIAKVQDYLSRLE